MNSKVFRLFTTFNFYILIGLIIPGLHMIELKGDTLFQTLNTPSDARQSGMNSIGLTTFNELPSLFSNPSQLANFQKVRWTLGYLHYPAEIVQNTLLLGWPTFHRITTGLGIKYLNYGSFNYIDREGNENGTFHSQELSLVAGASYQLLKRIYTGVSLTYSRLDIASRSFKGLTRGLGITYYDPGSTLMLTVVSQNGTASSFQAVGVSKHLEHLPLWLHLCLISPDKRKPVINLGGEFTLTNVLLFEWGLSSRRLDYDLSSINQELLNGLSLALGVKFQNYLLHMSINFLGGAGNILSLSISNQE